MTHYKQNVKWHKVMISRVMELYTNGKKAEHLAPQYHCSCAQCHWLI